MSDFKNKKILILGATAQTIPFVRTAKEMGIITYVADHVNNSPAKKYADKPLLINCFDLDALEQTIITEKIDGIVLGCADILLAPYQKLCERTGKFCYATEEQISVLGNKKGLKNMLKKYSLPFIPEYEVIDIYNAEKIKDNEFPVFIKPVDNCSSKGMSVCNEREDFESCCKKALAASESKTILVEQYMVCDDISITYTIVDGKVYVTSISDRYVSREQKGVGTITTALVYPSKYTDLYFETIHKRVCEMFEELKLRDGVLTIQAFVKDNKIMFYDPAFRVTGGQGYILFDYFGSVNQIRMLIEYSLTGFMLSDSCYISEECNFGNNWAANLVILAKTGKIGSINGLENVSKTEGVINVTQSHFAGDEIKNRGTLDQTIARIHLVAKSCDALAELIERVLKEISVLDVNGDDMLLEQFHTSELYK